ncbi:type III secretion system export apparatus subunit SctS [Pandoraea pulmonicola]|jgi:type III secretion protein S|uniref:EscS/YscS/HrcS family type III secretion system export apparatus protein n=1 Tax=Pandoraea pulmonicola TaxID=93221 RepID=A0AAJ5D043_PANPU|nr:type III secretion system export apparatus subunit SctS [Pandoraea pulmonicola]AJC21161.1 EscS/YscS/HrcS family type III secretion system export apparatus protein [Pandoraea pulmonicola]SUA90170.1 Flagellar biosynthetic protein FliQ [Pandoraea pulmonicola]
MSEAIVVKLTSEMLWLTLLMSLPTVVVAAAVGVLVSLVQALTQVQDQTVQFLIKLIAVSVTLAATYAWMGHVLLNYAGGAFEQISRMR